MSPESYNPWQKSYTDMYKELSVAQITKIQYALNKAGLPSDVLNLIDVYVDEGQPGEAERQGEIKTVLQEMLLHDADSAESQNALKKLIEKVK